MKKILLVVAVALVSLVAKAEVNEGFRMGLRGSIGLTNLVYEGDKAGLGYGADWVWEQNFTPMFYVQSGLGIQDYVHTESDIMGNISATFAQLPVHVGGRYYLSEDVSLFLQGGPTLGFGLWGSTIKYSGGSEFGYFDLFRRADLGIGARVGVELSKIQVGASLNYGLISQHEKVNAHNMCFNLSCGYFF